MQFKEIELADKELYDKYFRIKQYPSIDYNFTNLYAYREQWPIWHAIHNNHLCVKCGSIYEAEKYYLMPVGEGDTAQVIKDLYSYEKSLGKDFFAFVGVTLEGKKELEAMFPGKFEYEDCREYYEYIYLSEDLINLKGKKYHAKRNHINKFKVLFPDYQYIPFSEAIKEDFLATIDEWCKGMDCDENEDLKHEKKAILDLLEHYEELELKGAIIKIKDKIVACTLGQQMTDDMAVIHIEKADTDYQGAYAIINQSFCEREFSSLKYINREEDLNIEGLRKAKLSYNPIRLVEKYAAYLKEEL